MGHYRPLEPWPLGPPIGPLEPWTLEPLVLDLVPLNPYRPLEGVQGGPEGVQKAEGQWHIFSNLCGESTGDHLRLRLSLYTNGQRPKDYCPSSRHTSSSQLEAAGRFLTGRSLTRAAAAAFAAFAAAFAFAAACLSAFLAIFALTIGAAFSSSFMIRWLRGSAVAADDDADDDAADVALAIIGVGSKADVVPESSGGGGGVSLLLVLLLLLLLLLLL